MSTQNFSPARVVIFTADACLTASIETDGERVKDLLNTQSQFIDLSKVIYSNPERPGIAISEYANGTVRKSGIGCVVVLSEPPQTNVKKLGTYVQKRPIRVSVLITGMVVIGQHHTQGRFDASSLLTDALEQFVPLTEAGVLRARSTTPTSVPPERLTVFINRTHITGIFAHDLSGTGTLHGDDELARSGAGTGALQGTGTLASPIGSPPQTGRLQRFSNSNSSW